MEQRILEAGLLLPTYGAVTGWAALRWSGARWFDGRYGDGRTPRAVTLAVTHGDIRDQRGIAVTSERLSLRDLTTHDGLRITDHARSVCFEMRYAHDERLAVVDLDMAAAADLVSIAEVRAHADTLKGCIGIPRCRAAIDSRTRTAGRRGRR